MVSLFDLASGEAVDIVRMVLVEKTAASLTPFNFFCKAFTRLFPSLLKGGFLSVVSFMFFSACRTIYTLVVCPMEYIPGNKEIKRVNTISLKNLVRIKDIYVVN